MRCALATAAALALAACGGSETTEGATNALPVRVERTVAGWFGPVPPPPPVVATPDQPDQAWPNLGTFPPVPRASSPEERYVALTELQAQRRENIAESDRIVADSPFADQLPRMAAPQPAPGAIPGSAAPAATIAAAQPPPQPPSLQQLPQPLPPQIGASGRALATVVFDSNSAAFGEAQRQATRAAAAQLRTMTGRVRVVGFAGAALTPEEAAALARARAEAVAAELRAAGVPADRLTVQAPGAGSGRQVEIVVDL